jgi:small multidrug resistance family-3 protein
MTANGIALSVFLFFLAGLCEIGGGWLVWQWMREGRGFTWGLVGGVVLVIYGIVPTFQSAHFGRVYAAYGGVFILLSLLWGWLLDGNVPDRFDMMGAAIALVGVSVIMYWPR